MMVGKSNVCGSAKQGCFPAPHRMKLVHFYPSDVNLTPVILQLVFCWCPTLFLSTPKGHGCTSYPQAQKATG